MLINPIPVFLLFYPIVPSPYRPEQRGGHLSQPFGQRQGPCSSLLFPMFGGQSSPLCRDQKNRIQVARRILEGNPTSIRDHVYRFVVVSHDVLWLYLLTARLLTSHHNMVDYQPSKPNLVVFLLFMIPLNYPPLFVFGL